MAAVRRASALMRRSASANQWHQPGGTGHRPHDEPVEVVAHRPGEQPAELAGVTLVGPAVVAALALAHESPAGSRAGRGSG